MIRRTAMLILAGVLAAGCSSGSEAEAPPSTTVASTTAPSVSTTASTTTPATTEPPAREFEPLYADPALSTEEQVEAAYLFHWEVLLDSGRTGRTEYLPLVFTGEGLQLRLTESARLAAAGHRLVGHVEHNYRIAVTADDLAVVVDEYRNYLGRVDVETGQAIDERDGGASLYEYHLRKLGDQWLVDTVVRYRRSE